MDEMEINNDIVMKDVEKIIYGRRAPRWSGGKKKRELTMFFFFPPPTTSDFFASTAPTLPFPPTLTLTNGLLVAKSINLGPDTTANGTAKGSKKRGS